MGEFVCMFSKVPLNPQALLRRRHQQNAPRGRPLSMPLSITRDAKMLSAGLAMMLECAWAWDVMTDPRGHFFKAFSDVLAKAKYTLDFGARKVIAHDAKPLVRPPRGIGDAVRRLRSQLGTAHPDAGRLDRSRQDGADAARGAMAALLTAPGPKPVLSDEEHTAAVRVFCGVPEPQAGADCELCGRVCEPGHHRVCGGHVDRAVQHHATVKAVCGFINECSAAYARSEQDVRDAGEAAARADVSLSNGSCVEVKTVDTRQQAHRGKLFPMTAEAIASKVAHKYGSIDCAKLIITHAGSLCKESIKTVAKLQRLHDDSWPKLDGGPSLLAHIGAAAAKAEWMSYSAWCDRLMARDTAAALLDAALPPPVGGAVPTGTQLSPRDAGPAQPASRASGGEAGHGRSGGHTEGRVGARGMGGMVRAGWRRVGP